MCIVYVLKCGYWRHTPPQWASKFHINAMIDSEMKDSDKQKILIDLHCREKMTKQPI